MENVAEKILDKEILFVENANNSTIGKLSEIKNNLSKLGLDRSARLIKHHVTNEIDTMFWTKFFSASPLTIGAETIECARNRVFIGFENFLFSYNIDPGDDIDVISVKICSQFLKSDVTERWLGELFVSEDDLPSTYDGLKNFKNLPDDKFMQACEYLKILEDFRNQPSMAKYCKLADKEFSPLRYFDPSFRHEYNCFLEGISDDIRYALSLVKTEKEKLERMSFGLEQSVALYERAIPEVAAFLANFQDDLSTRLVIDNKPCGKLIKAEILAQVSSFQS